MAIVAALSRRRCLMWGLGFILTGALPLAFTPERSGAAYFVPSVGWAVYGCGFLAWLIEALIGSRARLKAGVQVSLLVLLLAIIAPAQRNWIALHGRGFHEMEDRLMRYRDRIHALIPKPRPGAHIIVVADADGILPDQIPFLIRLSYGDPSLVADRVTMWTDREVHIEHIKYDYALDWMDGSFQLYSPRVPVAPRPNLAAVAIGIYDDPDPAIIFRGGWVRARLPQPYAHTVTYSDVPGSEMRFRFRGDTLNYVYTKASNRGRAGISIDGIAKAKIDLYSATTQWQSRTTFNHLGPGTIFS
jgi:hypothetical protein